MTVPATIDPLTSLHQHLRALDLLLAPAIAAAQSSVEASYGHLDDPSCVLHMAGSAPTLASLASDLLHIPVAPDHLYRLCQAPAPAEERVRWARLMATIAALQALD